MGVVGARRPGQPATTLAWAALLVALVFCASFLRLEFSRTAIEVNNCVFGADSATYARALAEGQYSGLKPRKHPLTVLLVAGLARPMTWLGLSAPVAGSAVLALIQAAGAGLFFAFLRGNFLGNAGAFLLTGLVLSTFGTLTIFGVTETYGTTFFAVALACCLFSRLAPLAGTHPWRVAVLAGIGGAIAGLANPPALGFLLLHTGLSWRSLRGGLIARLAMGFVLPGVIAVAGTMLPLVLVDPGQGLVWHGNYLNRYASFANFADWRMAGDYLAAFLIFSFVAPLEHIQCRYPAGDIMPLLRDPLRLLALVAMLLVLGAGIAKGLFGRFRPLVLAALGVTLFLFVFYLYFNPDEALLYSSQWVMALAVAAAPGLASGIWPLAGAAIALLLGILVNATPLHHPRSFSPAACCPVPPATMLDREHPLRQQGRCPHADEVA